MQPLLSVAYSCGLVAVLTTGLGATAFLQFAFIGSFAIFVLARPSRAAILASVLLGAAIYAVPAGIEKAPWAFDDPPVAVLAFCGAGSLLVAGRVFASWSKAEYIAMRMLPSLVLLTFVSFQLLPSRRIPSFDRYLYAADQYLGQPSFAAGRLFAAHGWLALLCELVYGALPVAAAIVWARLPGPSRIRFAVSGMAAGLVGFGLYRVLPAAGPRYAFSGNFPFSEPHFSAAQLHRIILPDVRLNAMPSLHIMWTVLILWYGWALGPISRGALLLFLGFTTLATLGLGEHYAVDLIAALPCAVIVHWAVHRAIARKWRSTAEPVLNASST